MAVRPASPTVSPDPGTVLAVGGHDHPLLPQRMPPLLPDAHWARGSVHDGRSRVVFARSRLRNGPVPAADDATQSHAHRPSCHRRSALGWRSGCSADGPLQRRATCDRRADRLPGRARQAEAPSRAGIRFALQLLHGGAPPVGARDLQSHRGGAGEPGIPRHSRTACGRGREPEHGPPSGAAPHAGEPRGPAHGGERTKQARRRGDRGAPGTAVGRSCLRPEATDTCTPGTSDGGAGTRRFIR